VAKPKKRHIPACVHRDIPMYLGKPAKVAAIYMMNNIEEVDTPDGPMLLANLETHKEIANPDIGKAILKAGVLDIFAKTKSYRSAHDPPIYVIDGKTYVPAAEGMFTHALYYHKKRYALYEIKLSNEDDFMRGFRIQDV